MEIEESPEEHFSIWRVRLLAGGWDHLDEIRDRTTWERIKKLIKDKGAAVSFETIKAGTAAIANGIVASTLS